MLCLIYAQNNMIEQNIVTTIKVQIQKGLKGELLENKRFIQYNPSSSNPIFGKKSIIRD